MLTGIVIMISLKMKLKKTDNKYEETEYGFLNSDFIPFSNN